jgi:hypothetical protein
VLSCCTWCSAARATAKEPQNGVVAAFDVDARSAFARSAFARSAFDAGSAELIGLGTLHTYDRSNRSCMRMVDCGHSSCAKRRILSHLLVLLGDRSAPTASKNSSFSLGIGLLPLQAKTVQRSREASAQRSRWCNAPRGTVQRFLR